MSSKAFVVAAPRAPTLKGSSPFLAEVPAAAEAVQDRLGFLFKAKYTHD